jgi:hypothetical protein
LIKNALSEFFVVVEVHTLVAVVCDGGKLVSCRSVGGFDGGMESGLIGFGIPPVLDAACSSGCNLVVVLMVDGRGNVMLPCPCSMVRLLMVVSCSSTWQGGGDRIE